MAATRRFLPFVFVGAFFALFSFFASFHQADAQTQLVQCGIFNPLECQLCDLYSLFDRLIRFLIYLATPLAAILFSYAGYLYVTSGGGHATGEAKQIFKDVLIGFILILCAYLIVDTILRTLASGTFTGPSWGKVECVTGRKLYGSGIFGANINPALQPVSRQPTGLVTPPSELPGRISEGTQSDAQARSLLQTYGITVNKQNCSTAGQTGCTSLDGIRNDVIQQTLALKEACNCQIQVTGGTEAGHAGGVESHTSGYKIDLALNPALTGYIQGVFTPAGTRSDGAIMYKDPQGNIYAREGDHWDILISKGSGPLPNPPR